MGLFDKKYCDVCGEKIGLLGNRKLEDANLCKNCAAKLSPWFTGRRHTSLEDIKEQLEYRERNKEEVRKFHATRVFGKYTKLMIDQDAGTFVVTSAKDLVEANPDVVELKKVTGCELDVDENKTEIYRKDKDGKEVSYDPKRYEYSYDFYIIIRVDHPYIDEMKFKLNGNSIETGTHRIGERVPTAAPAGMMTGGMGAAVASAITTNVENAEYQDCVEQANQIKAIMLGQAGGGAAAGAGAAGAAQGAAQPQAVTCPFCSATVIPTADGRCEYCGGALYPAQ